MKMVVVIVFFLTGVAHLTVVVSVKAGFLVLLQTPVFALILKAKESGGGGIL